MRATITLLRGDGVGPEVVESAVQVLNSLGHDFTFQDAPFGIAGILTTGSAFPDETRRACESSDAVLLGAVGGPAGSTPAGSPRPEAGLLALRKHFGLFANLRPVKTYAALVDHAPLKPQLLQDVDILFVRELTGGIYFGPRQEPPEQFDKESSASAHDTLVYSACEVARVSRVAFEAARQRRKQVASVDKANVLASSRLWRQTVEQVATEYPDVALSHQLVDSFAMQLMTRPSAWDVVVTGNMFGDILSDEASILAGSLGMLPSASLNEGTFGVYEPVHGSAPDIAGQNIANPIGTILSAAMLLRYSLKLFDDSLRIEQAVEAVLAEGARTADIANGGQYVSTSEFTQAVIQKLCA
ncbi:MAG: 3-isopropylmalate dehydrogenase [Phototrophicales bacterium]|nr:MAG: 3-isopropylmalate dehydrogenase [Phototrophicales bacterium]